jgi:hypothetical protein
MTATNRYRAQESRLETDYAFEDSDGNVEHSQAAHHVHTSGEIVRSWRPPEQGAYRHRPPMPSDGESTRAIDRKTTWSFAGAFKPTGGLEPPTDSLRGIRKCPPQSRQDPSRAKRRDWTGLERTGRDI